MTKPIRSFSRRHAFLSNFASSSLEFEGAQYPTVEHAFQAAKTRDMEEREVIAKQPTPGKAKRAGRRVAEALQNARGDSRKVGNL